MSGPLSVTIGGVRLTAPVLPASGTLGLGHHRVFDLGRLPALVPKTVMPTARGGHPAPRLVEAAGGIVNAIGIPSGGISAFIAQDLPRWTVFGPPVIVSVSAGTPDEFAAMVEALSTTAVAAVELNLSCPNLEEGGKAFALDPHAVAAAVGACAKAATVPLWAKLTPNAQEPAEPARAAADAGAAALIAGNTLLAFPRDVAGAPVLANRTGGLSGPPIHPVALRHVDEIARATPLPVIGCGGVRTLANAKAMMAAGASAVSVGSATLQRPSAMVDLIAQWEAEAMNRAAAE
ncbi:MAG: tRNA-dihydrouridine synthase [Pseudomonadota bacterium]